MTNSSTSLFIGAVSFEDRSIQGPQKFLEEGGTSETIRVVRLAEDSSALQDNLNVLADMGIADIPMTDRFSSKSLWEWAWGVVSNAPGNVIVDATCLPRELLGMLLFALSRQRLDSVQVWYVAAPPGGYATQNEDLREEDRWLSQGVVAIRSILGYPGDFSSEKKRHLIALAGHEYERLLHVIVSQEPAKLSLENEQEDTSTAEGAIEYSRTVAKKLRQEIALPEILPVSFSAKSIEETFRNLTNMGLDWAHENVALVAMNTKLSFIGAALYALHNRSVRMIYAVPEKYNPLYCRGSGKLSTHDITNTLKNFRPIPAHRHQEE